MTLKIALLAVSIPLLALGSGDLYHVASNREQTSVTCSQVTQQRPRALWLKVTSCEIDYMDASYDSRGRIREIYFPVRPTGPRLAVAASLVAATKDPEVLALAESTIGGNRQPDQEAYIVMMLRIVTHLKASREVEGYVRTGVIERLQTHRALAGLKAPLAPGFLVLDLHARPRPLIPGLEVGTGLTALLLWAVVVVRHTAPRPVPGGQVGTDVQAPAFAEINAPEPVAAFLPARSAGSGRLPAMLLLNLDDRAGIDAIEDAPPLGSRDEVLQRLTDTCPGIGFDDSGRGMWEGQDFSLILDVGRLDPVWTATVHPLGHAAEDAARALAGRTGWRLYVPKQGTFLAALDQEAVI